MTSYANLAPTNQGKESSKGERRTGGTSRAYSGGHDEYRPMKDIQTDGH